MKSRTMCVSIKNNIRSHLLSLTYKFFFSPAHTIGIPMRYKCNMIAKFKNIFFIPAKIIITIAFCHINRTSCQFL